MDEKEIILRQIANTGFGIPVRHGSLIMDLEDHYSLQRSNIESQLRECLLAGYITVHNDKYSITQKGRNYLRRNSLLEYAQLQQKANNPSKSLKKKNIDWNKWGAIATILTLFITIIFAKC